MHAFTIPGAMLHRCIAAPLAASAGRALRSPRKRFRWCLQRSFLPPSSRDLPLWRTMARTESGSATSICISTFPKQAPSIWLQRPRLHPRQQQQQRPVQFSSQRHRRMRMLWLLESAGSAFVERWMSPSIFVHSSSFKFKISLKLFSFCFLKLMYSNFVDLKEGASK